MLKHELQQITVSQESRAWTQRVTDTEIRIIMATTPVAKAHLPDIPPGEIIGLVMVANLAA